MLNDLPVMRLVMQSNDCAEVFEGGYIASTGVKGRDWKFVLSLRCFSGQLMS